MKHEVIPVILEFFVLTLTAFVLVSYSLMSYHGIYQLQVT